VSRLPPWLSAERRRGRDWLHIERAPRPSEARPGALLAAAARAAPARGLWAAVSRPAHRRLAERAGMRRAPGSGILYYLPPPPKAPPAVPDATHADGRPMWFGRDEAGGLVLTTRKPAGSAA